MAIEVDESEKGFNLAIEILLFSGQVRMRHL